MSDESVIVDAQGRPMTKAKKDDRCPRCRADKKKRVPSSGFGQIHPVCSACGYEWMEETWDE